MANKSILRITRELGEIQRGSDLSIAVACRDIDVRHVVALIIGPPETPYEFGFFEFVVKFGKEYPEIAPLVNATTTNGGRTRFNPNIYANGKVCLSILGTWRGESGEEWSSAQGLESVLISIQSLMSPNPYENEPGFEDAKSEEDKKNIKGYVAKIRHETLRISIIERLEDYLNIKAEHGPSIAAYNAEADVEANIVVEQPFQPFKDLCKRRFLWYYDSYMQAVESEAVKYEDGTKFSRMPFECAGNLMEGSFQYSSLKKRLKIIREKLDSETTSWAAEGLVAVEKDLGIASNLRRQYEQIKEHYKSNDNINIDIELVENNPFVWQVLLFGRPMTNLDGGIFRIKVFLSPKFPDVLPRVTFETPIFHHRVSRDGVLCYDASKKDDLRYHIEAIVNSIEDESPGYDPRTMVNPEAGKLFWGSPEQKKMYNRKLRRCVQESVECF